MHATTQDDESIDLDDDTVEQLKRDLRDDLLDELHRLVEVRADDVDEVGLEDVWIAGQPLGKIVSANREKTETVEQRVEETAAAGAPHKTTGDSKESDEPELTPIERVAKFGEDSTVMADVTASVKRATTVFTHFHDWSKKTPSGRVVHENLKTLLTTARDEHLSWKQVYRACRKLEEWSKGVIQFKKHRRHGWMLVADENLGRSGQLSSV